MRRHVLSRTAAATAVVWLLAGLAGGAARASLQTVPVSGPVIGYDDTVGLIEPGGGKTAYITGSFARLGPRLGNGVVVDAGTGAPRPGWPEVTGRVDAVVGDGRGGWFIGGEFGHVAGRPRAWIAHLNADRTVDEGWSVRLNGAVHALARAGGTVYAGGKFYAIGGAQHFFLAALGARTGRVRRWSADANLPLTALMVRGSRLYAAGQFKAIGGRYRSQVAVLDAATGRPTRFKARIEDGWVLALAVSRETVYVGGTFARVDGREHAHLAALDARTGMPRPWPAQPPDVDGVHALALAQGKLFVGADPKTAVSGYDLFAVDAGTGRPTGWNPGANGEVDALAVAGRAVYAGGELTSVGGAARDGLAAVDTATGQLTSWAPTIDGDLTAMGAGGGLVYVAGSFAAVGGAMRHGGAALDPATGGPTAWNPTVDFEVGGIAVAGATVYLAGADPRHPHRGLAAVDAVTGRTLWEAVLPRHTSVLAVAVAAGRVYVGGDLAGSRLAAYDAATGRPIGGVARIPKGTVDGLFTDGTTVYAYGRFAAVGGRPRRNAAAIDAATGSLTAWHPAPDAEVYALAATRDTVYFAGDRETADCQCRGALTAVDARTGAPTGWRIPQTRDTLGEVYVLAVTPHGLLAGGGFTGLGGVPQQGLALFPGRP